LFTVLEVECQNVYSTGHKSARHENAEGHEIARLQPHDFTLATYYSCFVVLSSVLLTGEKHRQQNESWTIDGCVDYQSGVDNSHYYWNHPHQIKHC